MSPTFSVKSRPEQLAALSQTAFDLLIIGGGITGAGIALDAALRGLKVLLVEKKDFASGTSSRSTKLIHGGLRYLKQLELKLVHETGTERAIIHRNAPHLVKPEDMLLPIVEGGSLGKLSTRLALWVYDTLADVDPEERFEMLSVEDTRKAEPLLNPDGLLGSACYTEYRTDDARLTIEVIKTAVSKGAVCLNYAECRGFDYDEKGKITGAEVFDHLSQQKLKFSAKIVVNAAGPWVDELRKQDKSLEGKKLHLTKGVHIVVPHSVLPVAQAVYFDAMDGRMIFVVPRSNKTYIGTTDTNYQGDMHEPPVLRADVDYLLGAVNRMFPSVGMRVEDIVSSWAGLRPLIHEAGKSPSELSRKDEIFTSSSGLISIAGGKLTGFRKMAERITDLVCKQLGNPATCSTDKQVLAGGEFEDRYQLGIFMQSLYVGYGMLNPSFKWVIDLVGAYGTQAKEILELALSYKNAGMEDAAACLRAELMFGLERESVASLSDFLVRRTGRLLFEPEEAAAIAPQVLDIMEAYLGWDEAKRSEEMQAWQLLFEGRLRFGE